MKTFEERKYQTDTVNALLRDTLSSTDTHPVAAVPTGGGKTVIMARFIKGYLKVNPDHNILVVSHNESILYQDYTSLENILSEHFVGLYSSGLKRREIEQITVAGIHSIYRRSKEFKFFNLCIIDEAHAVPVKKKSMYYRLFDSTNMQRVGLTATPFRSGGSGYIYEGKGTFFNKLSYDLTSTENYNKLVDDGYLSEMYCKPPELQLDTKGVKITAGDFNAKELATVCDRNEITREAIKQACLYGKNYKSWLVFAINIDHANNINDELKYHGIESEVLHSKSNGDRHLITDKFKERKIRALVTVGMLTTGFDAPNTDLIILLRPTKSPVLHVQMIGRGGRVAPEKSHCLVLDYAGNVARLGPVNAVEVPIKNKKKGKNKKPITKTCPDCGCLYHPLVKICGACGHKFVFKEKIKTSHSSNEIIKKTPGITVVEKSWLKVTKVVYSIHRKKNSPNSLRVKYYCGLYSGVNEYICLDHNHSPYAKRQALNWIKFRLTSDEFPKNVVRLFEISETLKKPKEILVNVYEKYPTIYDSRF